MFSISCLCNIGNVIRPRVKFRTVAKPLYKELPSASNHSCPNHLLNSMSFRWYYFLQLSGIERSLNRTIMIILQFVLCRFCVQFLCDSVNLYCPVGKVTLCKRSLG